jgi:hypothetical protein
MRTDEKNDCCKSGIHLYEPSRREITDAKQDALIKDFRVIYIHRKRHP